MECLKYSKYLKYFIFFFFHRKIKSSSVTCHPISTHAHAHAHAHALTNTQFSIGANSRLEVSVSIIFKSLSRGSNRQERVANPPRLPNLL